MSLETPVTKQEVPSRLGMGSRLLYSAGYIGVALVTQVVVTWAMWFYAPPPEAGRITFVPVGLIGVAMVLGRIVDALADPLVGYWSDNTKSRFGRRLPFIMLGAVPLALSFVLIWTPPIQGVSMINFIYLAVLLSLFFFFFTVVVAPYLALLPEIVTTNRERVNVATWQALFNIVGLVIAMVGSGYLIQAFGFKAMGIILGLVALLSFYAPVIGVRERVHSEVKEVGMGLWEAMKTTLKNRPFVIFVVSQLLFWFGFNIIMMSVSYIVTVIMGLGEDMVGLVLGTSMLVAIISFPIITLLSSRIGKKKTFIITNICLGIVLFLLATIGRWPLPISTVLQGFIIIGSAGFPLAGLFVLPNAIIADITDYDEKLTSKRREAIYFGMQGLMLKSAIGLSSLATGFLLGTFGYSAEQPLGIILTGPVSGVFVVIGLLVLLKYPIED